MLLYHNILGWFSSYVSNRSFCYSVKNYVSSFSSIKYGVPQGLVLGQFFSLYMLPLGHIIRRHGVSFNFLCNNTRMYLPWNVGFTLWLKFFKTEILAISSQHMAKQILLSAGTLLDHIKQGNLGIWIDSNLSFDKHTTNLVQSCFLSS